MSYRASFSGTIWEDALRRAKQIYETRSGETVTCPISSCRQPNKYFSNPRNLRHHAHTYHSESINFTLSRQTTESREEYANIMEVDDVVFNTIDVLNPAPRPMNNSDSFIIIKHENNLQFQVKTINLFFINLIVCFSL